LQKEFSNRRKNIWLDKHAPFFNKENRTIISKEKFPGVSSPELKANYLNSININKQIVFIADDNGILKEVLNTTNGILVFQDSELID